MKTKENQKQKPNKVKQRIIVVDKKPRKKVEATQINCWIRGGINE